VVCIHYDGRQNGWASERLPALHLSCDAADSDGDDVADIPADGTSVAHVTARTSDGTEAEVTFRTTRGTLCHRVRCQCRD
jgi:hypothetical protein